MQVAQTASIRLADLTADRISDLWALHVSGGLDRSEFRALAVAVVVQANTAAVQLADLAVATQATVAYRETVAPLGLTPTELQTDQARINRDITRILEDQPETVEAADLTESRETRLRRLGRSEPLLTTAASVQTAMVGQDASGWVRQVDANPCPTCSAWNDGVIRNPSTRMARHLGCACIQTPIFN